MFQLVLLLLVVRFAMSSDSGDILEALNLIPPVIRQSDRGFLNSSFPSLDIYHVNTRAAKISKYPWIAQVVHSRTAEIPHMCTAVCVDKAIYITAARCIYSLKVKHTTILHMNTKFEALAFVLPSKPTKQMFDDIGIIVVDKNEKNAKRVKNWATIRLFNRFNRTEEKWSANLNTKVGKLDYKVVGYAVEKGLHSARAAERKFDLRELSVTVSHDICSKVLEQYRESDGFKVPCYYTCAYKQFLKDKRICNETYLGVEGAALIEIGKPNTLVGVATWGAYYRRFELPVGFSVVNSDNFFQDLSCARRIRGDKGADVKKGYYQNLCNSKKP